MTCHGLRAAGSRSAIDFASSYHLNITFTLSYDRESFAVTLSCHGFIGLVYSHYNGYQAAEQEKHPSPPALRPEGPMEDHGPIRPAEKSPHTMVCAGTAERPGCRKRRRKTVPPAEAILFGAAPIRCSGTGRCWRRQQPHPLPWRTPHRQE